MGKIIDNYLKENDKIFRLPIQCINNTKIDEHTINDLELQTTKEKESIYNYLLTPKTIYGKECLNEWAKQYTDNIEFLKESKEIYKKYELTDINCELECLNIIHKETSFNIKYNYFEWTIFEFCNNSEWIMLISSIFSILSPIFSLLMPILLLIIPYFFMKFKGLNVNFSDYWNIMLLAIKNNVFIKLFNSSNVGWRERISLIFSCVMYVFQVYNNIANCIRNHSNVKLIHGYFNQTKIFLDNTIENMNKFSEYIKPYKSYSIFLEEVTYNKNILMKFKNKINEIKDYSWNFKELFGLGYLMKWFYYFKHDKELNRSINYSLGFIGYLDNLNGMKEKLKAKTINFCTFNKKKTVKFNNAYYVPLIDSEPIKNSYNIKKNIILSGPNASGKTTLLKTTLFNIIVSQQLGLGCYSSANMYPYKKILCYLNIPDTSDRDSLFQAEARRCKNIIDIINESNSNDRYFCIFDELYSGTNPYEAIASAYAFIKYLTDSKKINFMLTTHFIQLCKELEENNKKIINMRMKVSNENEELKYTYKVEKSISTIKGGVSVLRELNYPTEIIINTNNFINEKF